MDINQDMTVTKGKPTDCCEMNLKKEEGREKETWISGEIK